jgi:hypothetical protein
MFFPEGDPFPGSPRFVIQLAFTMVDPDFGNIWTVLFPRFTLNPERFTVLLKLRL